MESTKDSAAKAEESLLFELSMHRNLKDDVLKLSKKSLFDTVYLLFDKRDTAESSENKNEGIDNLLTKSTIIQAFIAQILQTEDQYKSFLTSFKKFENHFSTEIKNDFADKIDSSVNDQLIKTLLKVEKASLPFPYSTNRHPSHNTNIQYFDSKNGKFFGVNFSNCVEYSVYHFLNCLFWNPMKRKYEFPIKQKNTDATASPTDKSSVGTEFAIPSKIVDFYRLTGKMRSNLSDIELKPWHEIVEDLPNGWFFSEYENQKSYAKSDKIFTHVTYILNPEGHLNGLNTGFLNFFVVIATIFDKKDLLKGISKSCLDKEGKLLEMPNVSEFAKFVKEFIVGITNLTENDFQISVLDLRIELVENKPELMGTIIVKRVFGKKLVEFHLDTKDSHTGVRIKQIPVLKFVERTESGEYIDFTDAKNLIIEHFKFNDQRFFMALYLESLFEEDKEIEWQNPMKDTVDGIIYKDFLRFEIGNNRETFVGLYYFYKIFLASLVETGKECRNSEDLSGNTAEISVTPLKGELSLANVNLSPPSDSHSTQCRDNEGCFGAIVDATHLITKISHIIANIILLPLPINDDLIFERVRRFYELAEFLCKIRDACQHFPAVLPQLSDKQLEDYSKIGENFRELLPKTSKFVEFDFEVIDNEELRIARKEITHKYWSIPELFYDDGVSLKKLFFFQNFSILDLSIQKVFHCYNFEFYNTEFTIWLTFQFRLNSKLVNRNSFDLLPKIRNVNQVDLVTELINEIPSILIQLNQTSDIPIKSRASNDISSKSDNVADILEQQLLNWKIIYAIMKNSPGELDSNSEYVKNNLTPQLACIIYFQLSRYDIRNHFSSLKNEQYSSYIGNYIVENMVPKDKKGFDKFSYCIDVLKFEFGVPLIENCNHVFLIRYYESWNKPTFESNPKSIFEDLNSDYPRFGFIFFLAQVMYRIHQKDENYNFEIPKLKSSLREIEIRESLIDVPVFCGTKTEQQEIVDYFLTFFGDVPNITASEVRTCKHTGSKENKSEHAAPEENKVEHTGSTENESWASFQSSSQIFLKKGINFVNWMRKAL